MTSLYLDMNIYNRPFDDQSQMRIRNQLLPGQGDYLEWQEQIFGDASIDEIYEQAQKHWKQPSA